MLMTAILNNGLEDIGRAAFYTCISLVSIVIPPTVRVIKDVAFALCSGSTIAILNDGLEEIGEGAFEECTSLCEISIRCIFFLETHTFLRSISRAEESLLKI